MKRKTNDEVLGTVKEKRWMRLEQGVGKWSDMTWRRPEELHNIVIVGPIEGKRTAGRPRNPYTGRVKNDARVETF